MEKCNIIKITKDIRKGVYEVLHDGDYRGTIEIINSPTGNCQMNSIVRMNNIRDMFLEEDKDGNDFFNYDEEGLKYVREFLQTERTKRCILFDVTNNMEKFMELLFNKDSILLKAPYHNTTGSDMIIYYVDMETI